MLNNVRLLYCRICLNTLCKTTVGERDIVAQKADCSGGVPIPGRYVTIQRFRPTLVLAEVDVEFYI